MLGLARMLSGLEGTHTHMSSCLLAYTHTQSYKIRKIGKLNMFNPKFNVFCFVKVILKEYNYRLR